MMNQWTVNSFPFLVIILGGGGIGRERDHLKFMLNTSMCKMKNPRVNILQLKYKYIVVSRKKAHYGMSTHPQYTAHGPLFVT
jgi:hypothetical protein